MGRPSKLDDLKAKRIVDAIANGNTRACAAGLAGCTDRAIYGWLAKGRNGDPAYVQFFQRVKEAEAKAEETMQGCLRMAALSGAPGTWKAAETWLERRRRKSWRKPVQPKEVEENDGLDGKSEAELVAAVDAWMKERKKTG
jgi:hypothetical protein